MTSLKMRSRRRKRLRSPNRDYGFRKDRRLGDGPFFEGREAYGAFGGLVWKCDVFCGWVVGLEVLKVFKVLEC